MDALAHQRPIAPMPPPQAASDMPWDDPDITPPHVQLSDHPLISEVVEALRHVYDPEIPVNLYELGLIYDIQISPENDVKVIMTLTTPNCPVAGEMPMMVQNSIMNRVAKAGDCDVELVWEPTWTPEFMAESARLELNMGF